MRQRTLIGTRIGIWLTMMIKTSSGTVDV
jgi:hypothetical protein